MSDFPPLPAEGIEARPLDEQVVFDAQGELDHSPREIDDGAVAKRARSARRKSFKPGPNVGAWIIALSFVGVVLVGLALLRASDATLTSPTTSATSTTNSAQSTVADTSATDAEYEVEASESVISFGQLSNPIGFDTQARIVLGGTDLSVWTVTVGQPTPVVGAVPGIRRIDIVLGLESSDGNQEISLPAHTDPWVLHTGDDRWPPRDQDSQCAIDETFVPLDLDAQLRVGDELSGALCIWFTVGRQVFPAEDVVLQTTGGDVVFSGSGSRIIAGRLVDRSLHDFGAGGVPYGESIGVMVESRTTSFWNMTVAEPVNADKTPLGQSPIPEQAQVPVSFELTARLAQVLDQDVSLRGTQWVMIGGATGREYPVSMGAGNCNLPDRALTYGRTLPAQAPLGHSAFYRGCATLAGEDAVSNGTVVVLELPDNSRVVFSASDRIE